MPAPSSWTESERLARVARVTGAVALLLVQAAFAWVVFEVSRHRALAPRSREERYRAATAAGPAGLMLPSALGYAERFDDGRMLLMTTERRMVARLDRWTYVATDRGPAPLAALRPGVGVLVYGDVAADGSIVADGVKIIPPP